MTKKIYNKIVQGQEVFGAFEVIEITGFNKNTFYDYVKNNLIQEGITIAWGDGTRTVYSRLSIYRLVVLRQLVNMGIKRKLAAFVTQTLDRDCFNTDLNRWIIFNGFEKWKSKGVINFDPKIILGKTPKSLLKKLEGSTVSTVINIAGIVQSIDEKIEEYQKKNSK